MHVVANDAGGPVESAAGGNSAQPRLHFEWFESSLSTNARSLGKTRLWRGLAWPYDVAESFLDANWTAGYVVRVWDELSAQGAYSPSPLSDHVSQEGRRWSVACKSEGTWERE